MTGFAWLPIAQQPERLRFEWGRIQSNADWILPIAAFLLVASFIRWMYRRDARELGWFWRWSLTGLRTMVLFGLLVVYLEPRWRTEREVVHPSRVVLLADTSLSMGLNAETTNATTRVTRSQQLAASMVETNMLQTLRQVHEVSVLRFDETVNLVAGFPRLTQHPAESERPDAARTGPPDEANSLSEAAIDWETALKPSGKETRLGQSLQQVLADYRGAPLSAIVVVSDGAQNAGPSPDAAVDLARDARVPIFTVGVGSASRPASVRIHDLESPERVHPGDPYGVTGLIQAYGMAGKSIAVQLFVRDPDKGTEQLVESQQVILGVDGSTTPVKFQVTPSETGRRQVVLRLSPPGARNPADHERAAEVEIVDRKTRVLLFTGGPSREYQFLKTLLYRDKTVVLDVLLQTANPGVSQEASQILDDFPATRQEMFAYDCVAAIDPRWDALSLAQAELLETWVAEQGGGLIVVAGPIHSSQTIHGWQPNPAMDKIRALHPVEFQRRAASTEIDTYFSKDPWPLEFSREGREAEFLWLADSDSANQQAWALFPGVYSVQPTRGPKPGATVFARFSDPQAARSNVAPPYLVGQFYGSGRVFYIGSGEMWRLRRVEEAYFDQFYTRLVRHVSQGRLLRQSRRGSLLVDKDRCLLGNTVEIRAQLTDVQLKPLKAPRVALDVVQPNGAVQTLLLRPDASREGMYVGQLTVLQEGAYRLELQMPDGDRPRLVRRIQVRLPDLERENPQRNDSLLGRIAARTGGKYYASLDAAWGPESPDPLAAHLKDRTRISIVTSGPNPDSERPWLAAMMFALCGLLCAEWLIRRLLKLA